MNLILILSHLLAAAIGGLAIAAYAMFLLAAAVWAKEEGDDDRGENLDLPTPVDPPSVWKRQPVPETPSTTPSSSPAPAAAQTASAPAAITPLVPPLPTSAKPNPKPRGSSATTASSAPPSAGPEAGPKPRATATLLDGPLDGLDIVADPTAPLTIQSIFGLHSYIPTDRFDLNRRVFLYCGPATLP